MTPNTLASCSIAGICLCGTTMPTSRTDMDSSIRRGTAVRKKPKAQPLSYVLLGLVILAVSPLLKTLTEATTPDSIAALSTTLFLISFALADFRADLGPSDSIKLRRRASIASKTSGHDDTPCTVPEQPPLPSTLSLNAALCASTVLASRLDSPLAVFSLVASAIFLFAFFPRWLKHHAANATRKKHKAAIWMILVTLVLLASSVSLLFRFSRTAVIANISMAVFLSILCPAWMQRAHTWKLSRRGPWDIGVPRLRTLVSG